MCGGHPVRASEDEHVREAGLSEKWLGGEVQAGEGLRRGEGKACPACRAP